MNHSNHRLTAAILSKVEVECPFIEVFGDTDVGDDGTARKKKAPDYANTDTATWLGELYACGAVGEMVADLERAGKRHAVITGVVEGGDPQVDAEIADWCRAAQVRRRFRNTNLAQIGRPYPGMMDLYIDEQVEFVSSLSEVIEEINAAPVVKKESNRLETLHKQKTKELEKATSILDGLFYDWKSGDISREQYRRLKEQSEEQIGRLQEMLAKIESERKTMEQGISIEDPYLTTFLKYRNIQSLSRGLLMDLVNVIYIHEDGSIDIKFNFADQYRRIIEFIENNKNDLSYGAKSFAGKYAAHLQSRRERKAANSGKDGRRRRKLYQMPKHIDELPLGGVIMAPEMLEPVADKLPESAGKLYVLLYTYDGTCDNTLGVLAVSTDRAVLMRKMFDDLEEFEEKEGYKAVLSHTSEYDNRAYFTFEPAAVEESSFTLDYIIFEASAYGAVEGGAAA